MVGIENERQNVVALGAKLSWICDKNKEISKLKGGRQ
jgi:hypothetical protein